MIAIMIPIKPYWFAKILNGEKSIEVRKNKALAKAIQKLIDTQGYAPILGYCSLGSHYLAKPKESEKYLLFTKGAIKLIKEPPLNGKVPALLICRKVEDFGRKYAFAYKDNHFYEILEKACMDTEELGKYYQPKRSDWENGKVHLYATHINEVKIFDKPKELSEFHKVGYLRECYNLESHFGDIEGCDGGINESYVEECYEKLDKEYQITKAPQNFCYVEVDE